MNKFKFYQWTSEEEMIKELEYRLIRVLKVTINEIHVIDILDSADIQTYGLIRGMNTLSIRY